jgi:hypothetical protein
MSVKIELGFTDSGSGAPFFTLNDPIRGALDNIYFPVGGLDEGYVDVTEYLQAVNLNRGKSRELDKFNAGQLSAVFLNSGREFDPTYEASPFFGQIVPRRSVRLTVNNIVQFVGVTDDWNIEYDAGGNSVASISAFDVFSNLANRNLSGFEPNEQLTGARINSALDSIGWSNDLRDIDVGNELLEAQVVSDGSGVLDYLSVVEQSELGFFFVNKVGILRFIDRTSIYSESDILLSDDGNGIPYTSIGVTYGSELLYNDITLTSTAGTVTVTSALSEDLYGNRQLNQPTFLANLTDLEKIGQLLLDSYKDPEYRFDEIEIVTADLSESEVSSLMGIELGDIVQVRFTPSNIPPEVIRAGRIISIKQSHIPQDSKITLGLQSVQGTPFILSSELFGIIGTGTLGY